jgi:hypothetical protein
MIRRFNYTDRQKIPRNHVHLAWIENGAEPLRFQGSINLALERPLDPAALVFVEAYSGPVSVQCSVGRNLQSTWGVGVRGNGAALRNRDLRPFTQCLTSFLLTSEAP